MTSEKYNNVYVWRDLLGEKGISGGLHNKEIMYLVITKNNESNKIEYHEYNKKDFVDTFKKEPQPDGIYCYYIIKDEKIELDFFKETFKFQECCGNEDTGLFFCTHKEKEHFLQKIELLNKD